MDHWVVAFADGGPSELWNLARICVFHHRLKTHRGWVLTGSPGKWEFRPPPGGEPPPGGGGLDDEESMLDELAAFDAPGWGGPPSLFDG
jgi:hypothetical protein